jgi:hypothetical protein
MRSEPPGCFADRTQSGGTIEIGAWPGRTIVGFSRRDLPSAQATVRAGVRLDDGPAFETDASSLGRGYAVTVRPAFAATMRTAKQIEFVVGKDTFRFDITNAGVVLDEIGGCAKLKTLAGMAPEPSKPLDDAPGWRVVKTLFGAAVCTARRSGPEGETIIYHPNTRGVLAVGIWRDDWMKPESHFVAAVRIDDGPVKQIPVVGGFETIMWLVSHEDQAIFKGAHRMTWELPWGTYTTDISGLTDAAETLGGCWTWSM